MCWRARAGVCCSIFSFLFVGLDSGIVLGLLFGQSSSLLSREHAERGHSGVYWHPRRLYCLATVASTGSIILVSLDSRRKCPAGRRRDGDGSRGTPLLGRSRHPMGVETESRDGRPITTRRFPSAGCHKSAPIPYGVPGDVVILDDPLGNPALRNTCSRRSPVGVQTRHRPVLYRCQSTRLLAHSFVPLAH